MAVFTLLEFISSLSFIAMTAYLMGRSRYIMRCSRHPFHFMSQFPLIVIFAFFAISSSYSSIPWDDSMNKTSLIGVLLAGIIGGPFTGFGVGVICGGYLELAEQMNLAHSAYLVLTGTLAGLLRLKRNVDQITPFFGSIAIAIAELGHILFSVFFSVANTPISLASAEAVWTILTSVIGTWLYLYIINWIATEQDLYGARAAQLSLKIASLTLPYLRHGLTPESAQITAQIIYRMIKVAAVSITDRTHRLAFIGLGSDHHIPGGLITSDAVKKVLSEASSMLIKNPEDRGCPSATCPLYSGVVVPLIVNATVIGTIELARSANDAITELDLQIADGLANLLSVQIQLADSELQKKMLVKAELKALRAQINPHFLFNTINIIMSFCRTDPDKARSLLSNLATLMQRGYSNQNEFLTLADEISGVQAYLEIAKSRFGDRLDIAVNIEDAIRDAVIPALSLQPLVENALNHGLFPKLGQCLLAIDAFLENGALIITIADNGVGIPPEKLAQIQSSSYTGVGLMNVHKRLISIYGPEFGLTITSVQSSGTEMRLRIPFQNQF